MSHFVVKWSTARMPGRCWGNYRKIAVLEVEDGLTPQDIRKISVRGVGVIRVVEVWDKLNVGTTARSAFHKAMAEALELAGSLNSPLERLAAVGEDWE